MVVHNLFDEITRIDNLITSWKEFRIGKKDRLDTIEFERNLEDNLWDLNEELVNETYKHSGYTSFFVQDPKLRHIHKALVRDRVLHHAIVKHINPIFDKTFINDSYSCRKDKGTHRGVEQLIRYGRIVSKNNTQPYWILKCDIKKFFASVDQKILMDMVFERIKGIHTRRLLKEVISSFSSDRTVDTDEPKGLPIGNLTSQLFANVYLNELDQFMKHGLHEKHYIRYADDFVILHPQREHCFEIQDLIKDFLKERLKLELHPNKITVRKLSQGVDFLGYICFPHFILPRIKTEKRIFTKIYSKIKSYNQGSLSYESLDHTIHSYLGILSHSNSFILQQDLENQIFFRLNKQ